MLLFHFQPSWLPGGFAGVDVFFVISGYLMTGIIVSGLQQQSFSLIRFYIARANRIVPALAVLCLTLLLFGYFYMTPWEYRALGKHTGASMGFVSNIVYWMEAGYFDAASKEKWLIHTWSLSVEWQFYLLYPLMLMVIAKIASVNAIRLTLVVATVAAMLLSIVSTELWPSASYFLLSARAWELMLGGIAFLYPMQLSSGYKRALEGCGVLLIAVSYLLFSAENAWPGYLALVPVLGSFFIIQAQRENSFLTNNIVFQKIGASSYSIYLWHWPIAVLGYSFDLPYWLAIGGTLSVVLGWLSYKYIESLHFAKRSKLSELPKVIPVYMTIVTAILGAWVFISHGSNYWLERQPDITRQTYQAISRHLAMKTDWGMDATGKQDLSDCRFNSSQLTQDVSQRLTQCYNKYGAGILILGDSHAIDLFGVVTSRFDDAFIVGITSVGCRPHRKDPNCQYNDVKQLLETQPLFRHVIYEQGGFYLLRDSNGLEGNRSMFSDLQLSDTVEGISVNSANVKKTLQYLDALSAFVPVTWYGSRIEPHITHRQLLKLGCNYPFALRPGQRKVFNELEYFASSQVSAAGNRNLRYISQNDLMNFDFSKDLMTCRVKYWDDGDHYSDNGEIIFGKRLPKNFLSFK